ncbi:hypothetical protein [Mucilaginibacter sp.]|uniref:hypothetical protein n=1 Tax=Mucilaginibacter sp. TaxID=1882438 RepID=UPI0035BBD15E
MKFLLMLLIIFSLLIGIPINGGEKGWISIYGVEVSAPMSLLKAGLMTNFEFITWILLLITHMSIFSLPFITKSKHFKKALYFFPTSYLILFLLVGNVAILLLLPFIITWIIVMFIANERIAVTGRRIKL